MRGILRRRRLKRSKKPSVEGLNDLHLRIAVLKSRGLIDGTNELSISSPYVVVRSNHYRYSTSTCKPNREGETEWNTEFSIPLIRANPNHGVSIIVWDRDRLKKMYLGEVVLMWEEVNFKEKWIPIYSLKNGKQTGELLLQILVESRNPSIIAKDVWANFLASASTSGASSIRIQPADAQSFSGVEEEDEDGLEEGEEEEEEYDNESLFDEEEFEPSKSERDVLDEIPGHLQLSAEEDEDEDYDKYTSDESPPSVEEEPSAMPGIHVSPVKSPEERRKKRNKFRRERAKKAKRHYEFNANSSVLGVAFLEIHRVEDLPPERNVTRTGFDMDPFVVVSFGKKTFRTPWKRHTLNPVFNEKLLFPIHKNEQMYSINFTVMDKDRFSLNDFVAEVDLDISDLLQTAPSPDPETGLYKQESLVSTPIVPDNTSSKFRFRRKTKSSKSNGGNGTSTPVSIRSQLNSGAESANSSSVDLLDDSAILIDDNSNGSPSVVSDSELKQFQLNLTLNKASKYESRHNPQIHIRGRFLPYEALRQHFWRGLIRLYDIDDTNAISIIELSALLDSLGSTLSTETRRGFFRRFNRSLEDELTVDEVVICLEEQVLRDSLREERLKQNQTNISTDTESVVETESVLETDDASIADSESMPPLAKSYSSNYSNFDPFDSEPAGRGVEHVIQISTCPVCNQPRLKKRSELDIVTHLAICASQNWAKVDALIMDRFVTSSQARKRWYSKVMSKVSYGNYKVGANSANILVQDRRTGFVMEEKMSAYVRLGIRLLYKGIKSSRRMEARRIRNLLRSLSIKQGRKYDSPDSVHSIIPFIKFHGLDMDEVRDPIESFKNFNEFFYRKLKSGARKCDSPEQPKIVVSPADSRTTMFNTISKATEIWIKGREFSLTRLFGDAYPDMVETFTGGSLAIFRLAPQDYHRFHIPVDGILGKPKTIEGEYYTVNPMAIRSALDVYGENVRVLVPIESDVFGTVMVVCVGAMMVGSTVITAKEGQRVARTDELGYFQFGGSTLVVLFEPNRVNFDNDLAENSECALETFVRVGMSIGHAPDVSEFDRSIWKKPQVTAEEKQRAEITITGGLTTDDDVSTKS